MDKSRKNRILYLCIAVFILLFIITRVIGIDEDDKTILQNESEVQEVEIEERTIRGIVSSIEDYQVVFQPIEVFDEIVQENKIAISKDKDEQYSIGDIYNITFKEELEQNATTLNLYITNVISCELDKKFENNFNNLFETELIVNEDIKAEVIGIENDMLKIKYTLENTENKEYAATKDISLYLLGGDEYCEMKMLSMNQLQDTLLQTGENVVEIPLLYFGQINSGTYVFEQDINIIQENAVESIPAYLEFTVK